MSKKNNNGWGKFAMVIVGIICAILVFYLILAITK